MRQSLVGTFCVIGALALSACDKNSDAEVKRAIDGVNVIDETNLNDIMLTVGDPNEAVGYFQKSLQQEPERTEFRRGLAKSLIRAGRAEEAVPAWKAVVASAEATSDDRIGLADALIRTGNWKEADAELDRIPPTVETYERYRLEAMVADSAKDWKKADSFYEIAAGLTTKPAGVLNNWGYSKLTRGDFKGAEKLFVEAITYDNKLFTAKNNLVLARGAQKNYTLPIVDMTQVERAQLLYTLGLAAVKQGDVDTGRGLIQEAVDTHPQHFEAAARALAALENNVVNG
jgi:Flp pilus assembly protein TadD